MSINKNLKQFPIYIVLALIAGLLIVFFFFGNPVSRYVWRNMHAGNVALALDKSDVALAMEIGNRYFGSVPLGDSQPSYDPALAKRAFQKALAIQPGILWAHYSLARIAFANGDFKTALVEINAELAANPENLRALYVRGLIYGYRDLPGDLSLAEADLHRFTLWAPTEWAGYNDLVWILLREGKYQDTLSVLTIAFKKVPNAEKNPWLLNDRGLAFLNLGKKQQAASEFQSALTYANTLTLSDWRRAYSGDSPDSDAQGLAAFRAGIAANLQKAHATP